MDDSVRAVRTSGSGGPQGGENRYRSAATEDEQQGVAVDDGSESEHTCPECSGKITWEQRENVCSDCGLVVEEDLIDRGPEWRAYDQNERREKCRVGAPVTDQRHDKGLNTNIGQSSDAESAQMGRLRKLNNQQATSSERNQVHSFAVIRGIIGNLDLPDHVHSRACQLFEVAQENELTVGRALETLAAASVYAACREHELPYLMDEVAEFTGSSVSEVRQTYYRLNGELELEVRPPSPSDFVPRLVSTVNMDPDMDVEISNFVQYRATKLVEFAEAMNTVQGRNPAGVAAAAIYHVAKLNGCRLTQEAAAGEWVATHTIRQSQEAIVDTLTEAGETVETVATTSIEELTADDEADDEASDDEIDTKASDDENTEDANAENDTSGASDSTTMPTPELSLGRRVAMDTLQSGTATQPGQSLRQRDTVEQPETATDTSLRPHRDGPPTIADQSPGPYSEPRTTAETYRGASPRSGMPPPARV